MRLGGQVHLKPGDPGYGRPQEGTKTKYDIWLSDFQVHLKPGDPGYGRPQEGTRTAARGRNAHQVWTTLRQFKCSRKRYDVKVCLWWISITFIVSYNSLSAHIRGDCRALRGYQSPRENDRQDLFVHSSPNLLFRQNKQLLCFDNIPLFMATFFQGKQRVMFAESCLGISSSCTQEYQTRWPTE